MSINHIHPTAIIGTKTHFDGITVNAFCQIDDGVKIGRECVIGTGSVIKKGVVIGQKSIIGEHVIIGTDPQDINFNKNIKSGVIIGNCTTIREMVTIHRATQENKNTLIGNNCFLMALSHYAHDVCLGDKVIVANNSLLSGHVKVGDGTFISGNCAIHQFVRLGRYTMVAAMTKVGQDVPSFSLAEGQPAIYQGLNYIGLKRANFSAEELKKMRNLYSAIYKPNQNLTHKLNQIKKGDLSSIEKEILDFFITSKRGVISYKLAKNN